MSLNDPTAFGPDFIWGAATSAYQIEGAAAEDGRSPSIWDTFSRVPGAVDNGDTGDVACDHYHRWPEDLSLMKEMGVGAYRFSVAWPRVLPQGTLPLNRPGLDFYDRLVDALLEAGITPYPTLYHWDLPQVLQDRGGWPARDTAEAFAQYASVVADALGDRVTDWCTLNEPLCSAWIGHLEGRMAPGWTDLGAAVRASHHLLLAHGLGMQAIRDAVPGARIGIVNINAPCDPASDRDEDIDAARRADGHTNRWWLDPVFGRGYPQDMVELYGVDVPIKAGDLEAIAAPLDWLGVNFYRRQVVTDDPSGPVPFTRDVPPDTTPRTVMDWEVHPDSLERLLLRVNDEYGPRRILITENGSAYRDTVTAAGEVHDVERIAYLKSHLEACARAARKGVPIEGYFAWSLLDNFEWAYGYDKRFGLIHVDFDTQVRTVKDSGRTYAEIIDAHRRATGAVAGVSS